MRCAVAVVAAVVIVGSLAGAATAQPGQTPAQLPPPYLYQPAAPPPMLTLEERHLLEDGEISDASYVGGGLLSLVPGFGLGQAVQGRWSDRGWIFTLGETAAMGLLIYGISKDDCFLKLEACHDDDDGVGEFVAGALAYTGFRVWEIIDAWAVPPMHNRRVRELRLRLGYPQQGYGATAGVGMSF